MNSKIERVIDFEDKSGQKGMKKYITLHNETIIRVMMNQKTNILFTSGGDDMKFIVLI